MLESERKRIGNGKLRRVVVAALSVNDRHDNLLGDLIYSTRIPLLRLLAPRLVLLRHVLLPLHSYPPTFVLSINPPFACLLPPSSFTTSLTYLPRRHAFIRNPIHQGVLRVLHVPFSLVLLSNHIPVSGQARLSLD